MEAEEKMLSFLGFEACDVTSKNEVSAGDSMVCRGFLTNETTPKTWRLRMQEPKSIVV